MHTLVSIQVLLISLLFLYFPVRLIAADGEVTIVTGIDTSNSNEDENENKPPVPQFIPTKDWQTILPGQAIPKGLHVRISMETGLKEAKLLEENPDTITYDINEVKEALQNIPSEKGIDESQRPEKRFRPIDEIKAEFAKANLNVTTETEIISSIISQCFTKGISEEQMIKQFNELEYYVHQYDNAKDFIKMEGLELIIPALNSSNEELRISAAHLIGSAMQGNPTVQVSALNKGILQILVHKLAVDSKPVQIKLLYAISCMIRHFPYAQQKFMELGGMSILTKFFQGDKPIKLQMRSLTIIYDLIVENQLIREHETDETKEKVKQYSKVEALKHFFTNGWCQLIAEVLTIQDNELIEKTLHLMGVTQKECQDYYIKAIPRLVKLEQMYYQLNQQESTNESEDEMPYYQELYLLINSLLKSIRRRDEL